MCDFSDFSGREINDPYLAGIGVDRYAMIPVGRERCDATAALSKAFAPGLLLDGEFFALLALDYAPLLTSCGVE